MTHVGYRVADVGLPTGWQGVRLKDLTSYVNRGVAPTYSDEPTLCTAFSQKCVRQDRSVDSSLGRFAIPPEYPGSSNAVLRRWDVVVNSTGVGTLGRVGLISELPENDKLWLLADGHVTIVRVLANHCAPKYLWYALATDTFYRFANEALSVGSTNQTELGRETLRRVALALPPVREQREIIEVLDESCERISGLVSDLGASNAPAGSLAALLEEHRQALITAAVTGGLDALHEVA